MTRRWGFGLMAAVLLAVTACTTAGASPSAPTDASRATRGPVAPLSSEGRWLTDATGRVVTLHGVNEVYKSAPYYPAAAGFGADDARFLAAKGFNAVRLGVEFQGLMPAPGKIDTSYIDNIATSVEELRKRRIFVMLDFHQDGFGPKYTGNGFPEWMSIDDGLPNPPDATFPLYYVQNPALQRAFESFWKNRPAADGVGLQDHFVNGLTAVVDRFADEPYVMGYELMNEPWPGHTWEPCVSDPAGCADLEQSLLVPFYEKATAAVREITDTQDVYVEPFVLFNFGQNQTSIPGADSDNALSFHSYALDVPSEEQVVENAVAAAERDGVPLVATEFGASTDPAMLQRLTGQLDSGLVSWMFWAYNENIMSDRSGPASLKRVNSLDALKALSRPYPTALTGTPTAASFDPTTQVYNLSYTTTGPDGQSYEPTLDSVISVPDLQYPDGYSVDVRGAEITSDPCSKRLTLRSDPDAAEVTLKVTPGGDCD